MRTHVATRNPAGTLAALALGLALGTVAYFGARLVATPAASQAVDCTLACPEVGDPFDGTVRLMFIPPPPAPRCLNIHGRFCI